MTLGTVRSDQYLNNMNRSIPVAASSNNMSTTTKADRKRG
jgi:hypothetical protein